uniref:Cation-transporting ATPase n=1 Tax=Eimeria acervulina TaxID=5801 RepID=B2LWG1_EIMAC|nr:cation-transporting ATPase [Eimeria acervulina]
MYAQEEAFKKSADFALSTSTVLSGVCLASGVLLSNTVCGPELSEWNIVNGVLCGALAASIHFAVKSCPRVLQNAFRLSKRQISPSELMSDGMLVAAVSVGIVAIPAILVLWSISGLFNMTIGTCAESAPLFYCVTLAAMLAQIAAIVNAARINGGSWIQCPQH